MSHITIITGDRGRGKTTAFLRHYHARPLGFGFYSRKEMEGGEVMGYTLCSLPAAFCVPLAWRPGLSRLGGVPVPDGRTAAANGTLLAQGRFLFSREAFSQAESWLQGQDSVPCLWLDEVGKLELTGQGFAPLLRWACAKEVEMVLTVRSFYVEQVVATFFVSPAFRVTITPGPHP